MESDIINMYIDVLQDMLKHKDKLSIIKTVNYDMVKVYMQA